MFINARHCTIPFALLWLFPSIGRCASDYKIVDLGIIGSAGKVCSINGNGDVVGWRSASDNSTTEQAFLYRNGTMQALGTLGGYTDFSSGLFMNYSRATSINDAGQIVGYSSTQTGEEHAFIWQNGEMRDMGSALCEAFDINNYGAVVGGSYLLQGESLIELGAPGNTEARAISNTGLVVGGAKTDDGPFRAFLWKDGVMYDLHTPPDESSWASDVNDLGQIVGTCNLHAFIWQDGVMKNLDALENGVSWACSINNRGEIVGSSSYLDGNNTRRATLWANGNVVDLGIMNGGSFSEAYSISDNGLIAGIADDSDGAKHAVLWQPVPEPSSLAALLCGMAGIGIVIRRRRG